MPITTTRPAIIKRLRRQIAAGIPIIGGGAGTGISAKCEEAGGIDLIVIYNSGRYRMAGRGSLAGCMPYGDANAMVMEMAGEILTIVKRTAVLAGVCGTDPFRDMGRFLREVQVAGFAGVQNFPTVGLCDGLFRANLEETGMGFDKEVDMIRIANGLGLLTTPYAFNEAEAQAMALAGADILVVHLGLTASGNIGAKSTLSLADAPARTQAIADAARQVRRNIIVLVHGGPVASPADVQFVLNHTQGVHGFYGASSLERLPVETAITAQTTAFKNLRWNRPRTKAPR
jgi:predicted TIM-barrel enzyme